MAYVPPPSWFDLARYAGASRLDFQGWATQLGNRFSLSTQLDHDNHEAFDPLFSKILAEPFWDVEFAANYGANRTVYPLTFGAASCLVRSIEQTEPSKYESCDDVFDRVNDLELGEHLHVTVDLNGSLDQITADLRALVGPKLDQFRQVYRRSRSPGITKTVTASWANHQILPYIDLMLWHRRQGQDMPSDSTMAEWIFRDSYGDKNKVRDTAKKASDALHVATLRKLMFANANTTE